MRGKGYRVVCPVCGRAFTSNTKLEFKMQALPEFHEHVMTEHKDWINSWYAQNKKNFRYVKRQCLKPFGDSIPIGYWLDGRPVIAIVPPHIVVKIRLANSYQELDEALEEIEKLEVPFPTKLQARVLRNWLVSYVLEKETTVEIGRLKKK